MTGYCKLFNTNVPYDIVPLQKESLNKLHHCHVKERLVCKIKTDFKK